MRSLDVSLRNSGYLTSRPTYRSRLWHVDEVVGRIRPAFADLHARADTVHIVGHSLGGLVALAYASAYPDRIGRLVLLGTPLRGSHVADLLHTSVILRPLLGRSSARLRTITGGIDPKVFAALHVGLIIGDTPMVPLPRAVIPRPNDGKVTVDATKVSGLADHLVLPTGHTAMLGDATVFRQTTAFLQTGSFVQA